MAAEAIPRTRTAQEAEQLDSRQDSANKREKKLLLSFERASAGEVRGARRERLQPLRGSEWAENNGRGSGLPLGFFRSGSEQAGRQAGWLAGWLMY